jgi:hypothetical protein
MLIPILRLLVVFLLIFGSDAAVSQVISGIKNLPYTVTKKSTSLQRLADGTTLTRSSVTTEARDSQGRTLIETVSDQRPDSTHRFTSYVLRDPANNTHCTWMSTARNASCIHLSVPRRVMPPSARSVQPSGASNTGASVVVSTMGSGSGPTPGGATGGSATSVIMPGSIPGANPEHRPSMQRESLPPKTVNGIYAEGVRITQTYPIGYFGNDRPIVVVNETWTSPELKIIVLTSSDDPRTGTRTTEVTNIDRSEPDPALFQIPEGYTISDRSPGAPNEH